MPPTSKRRGENSLQLETNLQPVSDQLSNPYNRVELSNKCFSDRLPFPSCPPKIRLSDAGTIYSGDNYGLGWGGQRDINSKLVSLPRAILKRGVAMKTV